ncbi:hypothetical protein [Thalassobellus suaedae]|uniref:Uncharacterized protein n=1 Tax=Thalassobellus suaedae TaxID=3074124 RepID=A0ABY9XPI9_9FLAO|nr:hypothetical protein RHP51_11400 [Flavobacteriaceae bacterium HL-DH14]
MTKYFCFLLFSLSLFSQETSISTQFLQDGILYKNLNRMTNQLIQPITEFNKNQKCIVIDYLGRNNYKIKFKDWEGIVTIDDLLVNEDMLNLFYDYQDKERGRVIAEEEERKRKILETINKENLQELEQKKKDSLAHVKAIEERQQEAQEKARKLEVALREQKLQDSLAHVKAIDQRLQEAQENDRKLEITFNEQERQDSLVNANEVKKKLLEVQQVDANINEEKSKLEENEFRLKCHYAIDEYDEFYKKIYIRTVPYLLNENLSVELYKYGQKVCVFFNLKEDLGCASYLPSNRSSVKVTLENNQIITFYHSWDMDCGDFSFKGRLSSSQINRLKTSSIKSISLKGTKHSSDILNIAYKEFFMDKLKCIE